MRLAWRLWRPRDAVELVAASSIVVGSALIVLCVGVVLAFSGQLAHREQVLFARTPAAATQSVSKAAVLAASGEYDVGNADLLRLELSPGGDQRPPGLTRWPRPGEVFASTAARKLMASNKYAAALVPGREVGTISRSGLRDPDEAYVVVGRSRRSLAVDPNAQAFDGFSAQSSTSDDLAPGGLLRAMLLCSVMLAGTVAVLLTTVTRLSGRARDRRLAVLQLLGASTRTVRSIAGLTTATLAAAGAVAAAPLVGPLNVALARHGIGGVHWWAEDRWVGRWELAVVAVVTTIAMASAARRTVDSDPWRVRRQAADRTGSLIWPVGLALGFFLLAAALIGEWRNRNHAAGLTGIPTMLLALSLILLFGTSPLIAPRLLTGLSWLTSRLGGLTARLAAARTAHQPRSVARLTAATMVLILTFGLTTGVWAVAHARYEDTQGDGSLTVSLRSVPGETWPQQEAERILRRRDLRGATVTRSFSTPGSGYGPLTSPTQVRANDLEWDFLLPAHAAISVAAATEADHPGEQGGLFDHEQSGPRATVLVSALVVLAQLGATLCILFALAISLLTVQHDRTAADAALLKGGMAVRQLRRVRALETLLCMIPGALLGVLVADGIAHSIAHVDDPTIAVPLGPLLLGTAVVIGGSVAMAGVAWVSTRRLTLRGLRSP